MTRDKEWVDVTTIDQAGRYEVSIEIYTNKIKHRVCHNNGLWSKWKEGKPPKLNIRRTI